MASNPVYWKEENSCLGHSYTTVYATRSFIAYSKDIALQCRKSLAIDVYPYYDKNRATQSPIWGIPLKCIKEIVIEFIFSLATFIT